MPRLYGSATYGCNQIVQIERKEKMIATADKICDEIREILYGRAYGDKKIAFPAAKVLIMKRLYEWRKEIEKAQREVDIDVGFMWIIEFRSQVEFRTLDLAKRRFGETIHAGEKEEGSERETDEDIS